MTMNAKKWMLVVGMLGAGALALAGCGDDDSTGDTGDGGDADITEGGADADADADAAADAEPPPAAEAEADGSTTTGTCDEPGVLACDDNLTDETTTGQPNEFEDYSACGGAANWTGPEMVYEFAPADDGVVTITMTPTDGQDLDLFIFEPTCGVDMCTTAMYAGGDGDAEVLTFEVTGGSSYYVVVDGWDTAVGGFTLEVECAAPEICDNGSDDNGDGLVDCLDPQCTDDPTCDEICDNGTDDNGDGLLDCYDPRCAGDPACDEVCDDTEDNDLDLLTDCDDPDCAADAACTEGSCSDTLDGDGDTLVDCADGDCMGDTACATGAAAAGAACAANTDCAGGACLDEAGWGWVGGYCIDSWENPGDCSTITCGTGAECACLGMGACGCFDSCATATDCRAGYECADLDGDTTGDLCGPHCTAAADCAVTGYCNTDSGFCTGAELCAGGIDEDADGDVDCADSDCAFDSACLTGITALAGGADCAAAVAITVPSGERGIVAVTGTLAATDGDDHLPRCQTNDSADVYYSFTLTAPARVTVDLMGAEAAPGLTDTVLSLASACTGPDLACNDDMGGLFHSRITGVLAAGTYYVIVDGYSSAVGDYTLGLLFADP
jgi:hypothetical protein